MMTALLLLLAYLVGSVPSGYVLVRLVRGCDVRGYGSHSSGAINVARVGGIGLGLATLAADVGKAMLVVVVLHELARPDSTVAAAAILVMVGHAWSVWLLIYDGRLAEGKSVACALGVMVGLAAVGVLPWGLALAPLGLWVVGLVTPRALTGRWYCISPVTMLASASIPVVVWAARSPAPYFVLSLSMAGLILIRHKNNIRRLIAGTEPRLGERLPEAESTSLRDTRRTQAGVRKLPALRLRTEGGDR